MMRGEGTFGGRGRGRPRLGGGASGAPAARDRLAGLCGAAARRVRCAPPGLVRSALRTRSGRARRSGRRSSALALRLRARDRRGRGHAVAGRSRLRAERDGKRLLARHAAELRPRLADTPEDVDDGRFARAILLVVSLCRQCRRSSRLSRSGAAVRFDHRRRRAWASRPRRSCAKFRTEERARIRAVLLSHRDGRWPRAPRRAARGRMRSAPSPRRTSPPKF